VKIIIPAAGQGTRLRPHTHTLPKVMLPVAGRPIIGHILADVASLEPSEIRLVVGYRGDSIEAYVNEVFPDLPVEIVWQHDQLGLGHAVLTALEPEDHEPALVVLGDTVFDVDYGDIVSSPDHALGVRAVPDPERFGIVELDSAGESVVEVVEKPTEPKGNLALAGLYFVRDAELLRLAMAGLVDEGGTTRGEYQLTDALQRMIDAGERFVPYSIGGWFDCGKPETLLATNRELLDRNPPKIDVSDADVRFITPVFVGPDCDIKNSIIGPHVSLSSGVTVRDAVIRDSIIGDHATVCGFVLEGSIIGPGARVEAAPVVLNLGEESELIC
jgi:glucose-1-phosphate thymidylyltransferase